MKDQDAVFKALGDATRRTLLDRLFEHDGQSLTQLCEQLEMTRQAVTQHLLQLEAAGLVVTAWQGREKRHFLNAVPLQQIHERWIRKFEIPRLQALQALKRHLEGDGNG